MEKISNFSKEIRCFILWIYCHAGEAKCLMIFLFRFLGVLEIAVSQVLADPFRRDALAMPIRHLDKYKTFVWDFKKNLFYMMMVWSLNTYFVYLYICRYVYWIFVKSSCVVFLLPQVNSAVTYMYFVMYFPEYMSFV